MEANTYGTDLTDDQWTEIEPFLDPPRDPAAGGRPCTRSWRHIANAVFYQVRAGGQWRYLSADFPPWPTVWSRFRRWRDKGVWARALTQLRRRCRIPVGRNPEPSAVLLDAQSVPSGRIGPRDSVGVDGGKNVKGRKRHLHCDIDGLPVAVDVGVARRHDSRGGLALLSEVKPQRSRLKAVFVDAGYESIVAKAKTKLGLEIIIQRRPPGVHEFVPLKPLWRIERSLAWLGRHRRLRNDYEATNASSQAFAQVAAVSLMLNRLRPRP